MKDIGEASPRYRPIDRRQLVLRTVDVEELIEANHHARNIWDFLGALDLSRFEDDVKSVEGRAGRNAWSPQLLIALWIYGYSRGISSAREIERQCAYEPALQWLTGLQVVNHHTLSDFRTQHGEALRELFVQVLGILEMKQLITLERVAVDGTRVRANVNKKTFSRPAKLRAHLQLAREQVERMEQQEVEQNTRRAAARKRALREREQRLGEALKEVEKLQAEKRRERSKPSQASTSDPEARFMRNGDGGVAPSYNVQVVSDARQKLIADVAVVNDSHDTSQLGPAMDRVQASFGRYPTEAVADGGYTRSGTVVEAAERNIDYYGSWPEKTGTRSGQGIHPDYEASRFRYDEARDEFQCPADKKLRYLTTQHDRPHVRKHVYAARREDCSNCPHRRRCTPRNAMSIHGRTVTVTEEHPHVTAFRAKMQQEDAKAIYRQRAPVAEFPNAWLKEKLKLRRFRCRGLRKVTAEATWAALTYNLQRLFKLLPEWREQLAVT